MKSVIEARSISREVDGHLLLDRVELEVSAGECFGVVGPKNSGKTQAMKVLAGQAPFTAGELFVLGHNARVNSAQIRAAIGVLPQSHGFEMDTTVLETLVYHGILYGLSKAETKILARDLLRQVQLDEAESWSVFELSESQLVRLSLARAQINRPQVLFIDNDLQNLSAPEREKFWVLIEAQKRKGTTIILSSRDLENVERLCDRVVVIESGRIICKGKPEQLVAAHVGRSVVEYRVKPNELEYHLQAVEGKYQYQLIRDRLKIFVDDSSTSMSDFRWVPSEKIVFRKAELRDVVAKLIGHETRENSL